MKARFLHAPKILGAFFLACILGSCREEKSADWPEPTLEESNSAAPAAATTPPASAQQGTQTDPAAPNTDSADRVRFLAYNVENWLSMDRYVDGKQVTSAGKPEKEKEALVTIVARQRPDVFGLCEIGSEADLADLQSRLTKAGLELTHSYYTGGGDDTRHLALLSRFPITRTVPHKDLEYRLNGREFTMGRGILDATLETPVGTVRFLGTHLKSKREVPEGDQEQMRRSEAHIMRREIESALREDSAMPLIIYGDMNDTRQAPALRILQGPRNGPLSIQMVHLRDSVGTSWTHHWSYQDVYSRFDYVLFNSALKDRMLWDDCHIVDDPEVADASDHRPIVVEFR
ncbi:endonuclease/exonuclease/phosphatase family metal-dependent hydrolase [Haloferula luteola]|uniref:Endonuclease/exonuclease/phosphatase family metal-dependent hydrolase n=1 Tax=Haloferula luteola TaxID=595692 RepID=A0A840VHJ1_9BACT|nr:endonuclease/exonuclease/phosphatase family protein [Haloferula luteola]MBB5353279.1 endonuclease/exonuclease/phosphatase family metal-dependent hydrolase [Haloferula luteola]